MVWYVYINTIIKQSEELIIIKNSALLLYFLWKAYKLQQNASFQTDGDPTHITCTMHFPLDKMFPNWWTENMAQQAVYYYQYIDTHWTFFLCVCRKDSLHWPSGASLSQLSHFNEV